MKKIGFLLVLLMGSSAPLAATPQADFSGFYGGIIGGYKYADVRVTSIVTAGTPISQSTRLTAQGPTGGVSIFCGHHLGDSPFYMGLEGLASLASINTKNKNTSGTLNSSINFSEGRNFGASLMLGYVYNNMLPYLKVGFHFTQWKATTDLSITGRGSVHEVHATNLRGLVLGLGGLSPLTTNLFWGWEFTYARYASQSFTDDMDYVIRPHTNTFMLKLLYKFF